jgi:hypothetical protein
MMKKILSIGKSVKIIRFLDREYYLGNLNLQKSKDEPVQMLLS